MCQGLHPFVSFPLVVHTLPGPPFLLDFYHARSDSYSLICHCPEGRGREGVGSLVVQLPRIGGDIRQKVENEGEDPGRCGEDGEAG